MKQKIFSLMAILSFLAPVPVFAGGAVMKRQQMQQQKMVIQQQIQQRQMQQAAQKARQIASEQVMMEQKKMIQEVAIEKAMIERQIAAAQYQAARQAALAQQQALQQAAVAQYQATRQITAAQQRAVQEVLLDQAIRQKVTTEAAGVTIQQALRARADGMDEVRDIVTLDQFLDSLKDSSRNWALIIDPEAKQAVVEHYIRQYESRGIVISKPAVQYASMIDAMSEETPHMLDQPFERILQVTAIVEYDFDNGQNKDAMALQILGEEGYRHNRERLGLP